MITLSRRLGVEVVELDGLADPATHRKPDHPLKAHPRLVSLRMRVQHAGHVVQTLALLRRATPCRC